ncbi:transcriptional regulator with XRE-family HTH domain [Paenibacillus sp. PvP094]|uniref:helix-turn-helix transcriptional regulator n=1 Tax=Paenibacillus sp. PvP094 TaxID=3156394 RepID=UPI003390D79A
METTNTQRLVLKNCRKSKGTQREVATDLGITEVHWREIENGKSVPGTRLLFKICNYLGENVYVLFPDLTQASFFDRDSN